MTFVLLIAGLVALTIIFAAAGIQHSLRNTSDMQQRLLGANMQGEGKLTPTVSDTLGKRVDRRLRKYSYMAELEQQLAAANSKMSATEHILLRLGCVVGGFVLGWFISGIIFSGLLLAIVGWMVPALVLSRQQAQRVKAFNNQLPDMLNLMVGSLRAGHGLLHACNVVSREMPEPLATEIGVVIRETSLGYNLDEAWDRLADRMGSDDLDLIVTCFRIQNEVGGSLADVLDTIAQTIRERIKLKGEIGVLTAQQRLSGWVLSLLPFVIGTALMLLNPDYMMGMFEPGWPRLIPVICGIMIILGNVTIQQILKIDV
jgi:tight adherence protein B